jgi:hypothetical protein
LKTALISLKEVEINIKVVKKENEIYHVVIYTRNNIDIIEPLLYSTKNLCPIPNLVAGKLSTDHFAFHWLIRYGVCRAILVNSS